MAKDSDDQTVKLKNGASASLPMVSQMLSSLRLYAHLSPSDFEDVYAYAQGVGPRPYKDQMLAYWLEHNETHNDFVNVVLSSTSQTQEGFVFGDPYGDDEETKMRVKKWESKGVGWALKHCEDKWLEKRDFPSSGSKER